MTDMTILAGRAMQRPMQDDTPADRIFVRDYVLPIHIGVYAEEQGVTQKVGFTVEAELARSGLALHDEIVEVPSYDDILKGIRSIVDAGHINLVETLAERVAAHCLADPRIASVRVRIEKLERGPAAVGVEIVRPLKREREVRHAQARHGVSDRAAHLMAMLAMHQTGLLLEDLQARFIAVETLAAISKALAANRIPVWLPLRLSEADDAIAADWSVTSDALAARLAERLRLGSVFLVKSRRVPAGPSAAELANAGIVDASFGEIVERARLSFRVFGPGEERELAEACLAQRACACEGRRPAGRGERARRSPRRPHPGAYVTPRG